MVLRHVLGCNAGTGFSGRKTSPRGQRSKSECTALTSSFDRNNNYGQASLKRQKSPETTTDIQDVSFTDFTCKNFLFRNNNRCKSSIFRSSKYSLERAKISTVLS